MTILWKNLHLIWDCGVTDLVYSGLWEYIKGRVLGVQRAKFRFFILVFAIYPVAYGVGFTLLGLPIVKWISNFKQQPIVGGQYFNVPKPTGSG